MNDKQGCLGLALPNLTIFLLVGLGIYSSSDPLTSTRPGTLRIESGSQSILEFPESWMWEDPLEVRNRGFDLVAIAR
jgi:hypothetical protein